MNNRYTFPLDAEPRHTRSVQPSGASYGIRDNILASTSLSVGFRSVRIESREIDTSPFKILDAPGMLDDYYLNLLDWSSRNIVTIGLNESAYMYNPATKKVFELLYLQESYISSVCSAGATIAVGTSSGALHIIDQATQKTVREISADKVRIPSLSWNNNVISAGLRNGIVKHFDIRTGETVQTLRIHNMEVCGLKWSPDKKYLASGGNDNLVQISQLGRTSVVCTFNKHKGAVKALDWCPWRSSILATGGGTKDKTIRFWDVDDKKEEKCLDVESQVCNIKFMSRYKEMITSHGYVQNNICVWKVSGMNCISSFGKHEARVLHIALSPDEKSMASVSADENLKFWKLANDDQTMKKKASIDFR